MTDPDGKTQTLNLTPTTPGRATASLPAVTPGVWQASDGTRAAYAAAGAANPLEFADLRATGTLLRKLVRASGGGVHSSAPASPMRRRTSQSYSEPSLIARHPAVHGSACSGVTTMW